MRVRAWIIAVCALAAIAVSVWQLERDRAGLEIEALDVGAIPATVYRAGDTPRPVVVIAHGFAGSRQLMEPFALTLAQAGYAAVSFDFAGHGRNPVPMSGDVTRIDGTTRLLMDEVGAVTDAALAQPWADGRVALLGHSMASDIIVRQALEDARVEAVVAISMFSEAVTADAPVRLLILTGEWEGLLAEEALRALRLVDPGADYGETVGPPPRRAVLAPSVEHVGVLYSGTSLREARAWLGEGFGQSADGAVTLRGGWILLLLGGLAVLAWPLSRLAPVAPRQAAAIPRGVFWQASLLPALITPLLLWPVEFRVLPVLVADYLGLHMLVYGGLSLFILWRAGILRRDGRALIWGGVLALYGIAVFGGALDRYVSSFMPHAGRIAVIAVLCLGAIPYMLSDAILSAGGAAPIWRRLIVKLAFLGSLGIAVALDFEGLMFLLIILPVIVLFFSVFGLMGGWVGRRIGTPYPVGLGLGLVLAWSLGVTFPMFAG
ncbi:hypothetical protein FHS89_002857 [Rubricella aquisinus]|uniref:Serine aminopeptidase S33 domain-containing protein n=1 Tax=Rubricella aquisinus TaxID=2028108 RepID=A0A840X4Q1_9RHOB|nr:alpha/beta fold hydrolase [Rubricella aquisinus]MBB5516815.1 hypothetical protein [Rubricella aquisinus]